MMNEKGTLHIHTRRRGAELGDLFGIFFEDLNHAADGGLYAELVQNRSFEFDPIDRANYHALTAWEKVERRGGQAELTVEGEFPLHERNRQYAVVHIIAEGDGVGISNEGFNTGIPVVQGERYRFSVYARRDNSFNAAVRITLESQTGQIHGESAITVASEEWTKYETVLTAASTDYSSRLVIVTGGEGKLFLDMVSLFPETTYRGRTNGLRQDIAAMIADLKPKFMRFPGGCLVHDGSLNADDRNSMYRWKNTLGDIAERPSRRNNWGYNQTLGLGYYEYFQYCEDIGAKPIPILPAGYDPHHKRVVPLDELEPWINDALDLIEFANGDSSTEWGAVRTKLGHPEPFGLEYIGIGNEEVGEPFFERYAYFHRAIKAKYPDVKIINSSGPFAAGGEYERGWQSAREHRSDFVDEHYYQSPEWFLANIDRYDRFKADEPKVFLGEYASWGNTYYNALVEAAFMTGLERNAHAVQLACYAPMLCNVDYVNWKPDLIWFDNHQVFGTANYYVQQLFMHHQGDQLLTVEEAGFDGDLKLPAPPISGKLALGADQTSVSYRDVKLVNNETGEVREFVDLPLVLSDTKEDRENGTANRTFELGETEWGSYTLHVKAEKLSGPRGFILYFGKQADGSQLFWEIGGWQNQDAMLTSQSGGRNSCLTQHLFAVEEGITYELALEVAGRRIRAYIDGVLIHETEDKRPVIRPLYYTSSIEHATGDIIVKVVNVQEAAVAAQLILDETDQPNLTVNVHELSGHALDEENSFASPERIRPKHRCFMAEGRSFDYQFQQHSVTVFRIS